MRKLFYLSLAAIAFLFCGCLEDGAGTIVLPIPDGDGGGKIPSSVIPDAVRDYVEDLMPIHSGVTPPDIVGQYRASPYVLVGSSDGGFSPGHVFADRDVAFVRGTDGKLSFFGRQGGGTSGSDDVTVEIVGNNNNFTAYFVATGVSSGISNKQSILISGTLTNSGISNFHYAFILLEKGPDPDNTLVPVNTYRVFKDSDGLAEKYNWR